MRRKSVPRTPQPPLQVATEVLWSDQLTDYDRQHLAIYLRVLDAVADRASPEEMARVILQIDPAREPVRAKAAVASHAKRARWMAENGHLLAADPRLQRNRDK